MNGLSTLVTRLALSTRLSIIDLFAFGFLLYFATIGHHSFHYCFVNLVLRISMARPTGRRPAHCKTTMANNTTKKKRHQLSYLCWQNTAKTIIRMRRKGTQSRDTG